MALLFSAQASHIIPGPCLGYLNESMSVLITLSLSVAFLLGLKSALKMALLKESPLIRCAAQSALISLQGIPHTFSV